LCPLLLTNIRDARKKIWVKGVKGIQMIVNRTLESFFEVYASNKTKSNFLSFTHIEDMYKITYVRDEGFMVHMHNWDPMVKENELLYSKEQVCRVKAAHKFICNCGYPLPREVQHIYTPRVWEGQAHEENSK
jgi:hypothetical protein